jgi:hypothetical protein
MLPGLLGVLLCTVPALAQTQVDVATGQTIATVPEGLYGTGYDGWGDITDASDVTHLQGIGIRYCRMDVNLRELCGERFGDWQWEYTTPRDLGLGFVSRVRRIIANGWTPMLALTTSHALPRWFVGDPADDKGHAWFQFNLDGSPAAEGASDQWAELTRVTQGIAAGLAQQGLTGLLWETIYEMGHTMPLPRIHYQAALGIHQADPTARLMGPATWPGWTVEERFVKPYLSTYGPDLLDYVSVHWYADNEHGLWAAPGWNERRGPVTMADELFTTYLMETTPKYAVWCRSLRALLDDPALNPGGKRIGICYSEYDALAGSAYGHNPPNPDWPAYRADADCYLNTNAFGGVWSAAVLCDLAAGGDLDIACKFCTRQYYGLTDNAPGGGFYRQPIWFAWKLLQQEGGLVPGATMLQTSVQGPTDDAAAHLGGTDTSWVSAYAIGPAAAPRLILINRSRQAQPTRVALHDLPAAGTLTLRRYVYDASRTARFIGPAPGTTGEGAFEGVPDDSANLRCLEPTEAFSVEVSAGSATLPDLRLPPLSLTVIVCATSPDGAGG